MTNSNDSTQLGLCAHCDHARHVPHPRGGSAYCICERAESDSRYDKYPRTPVQACAGYEPQGESADET